MYESVAENSLSFRAINYVLASLKMIFGDGFIGDDFVGRLVRYPAVK